METLLKSRVRVTGPARTGIDGFAEYSAGWRCCGSVTTAGSDIIEAGWAERIVRSPAYLVPS